MANRVRVRRDRPSALSWALALAVTMLAVYLVTLSVPAAERKVEETSGEVRATRELTIEGATVYFADLGCFADAGEARIAAAGYAGRGAAGCVRQMADGWHVLGAGYGTEADAARIAERLSGTESIASRVVMLSAPSVSMRITARQSDAEAIAQAERTLRQQLSQAASMALQVDRGELTAASARALAGVARSEALDRKRALERVAGAEENDVCRALAEQLEGLAESLGTVARGRASGATLSGQLRCCHVSGILALMDFLNGLSA